MRLEIAGIEPSVVNGVRITDRQALASPHSVRFITMTRRLISSFVPGPPIRGQGRPEGRPCFFVWLALLATRRVGPAEGGLSGLTPA
jgi:hypothetical protein